MAPHIPFPDRLVFLADQERLSHKEEMFKALCIPRDGMVGINVEALFFDYLVARFDRAAYGQVTITGFRLVKIHDGRDFVGWLRSGGHLGGSWTEIRSATFFHGNLLEESSATWLARADIPLSSVDWHTTFSLNFKAPWRREIHVTGPMALLSIERVDYIGGNLIQEPISLPASNGSTYSSVSVPYFTEDA